MNNGNWPPHISPDDPFQRLLNDLQGLYDPDDDDTGSEDEDVNPYYQGRRPAFNSLHANQQGGHEYHSTNSQHHQQPLLPNQRTGNFQNVNGMGSHHGDATQYQSQNHQQTVQNISTLGQRSMPDPEVQEAFLRDFDSGSLLNRDHPQRHAGSSIAGQARNLAVRSTSRFQEQFSAHPDYVPARQARDQSTQAYQQLVQNGNTIANNSTPAIVVAPPQHNGHPAGVVSPQGHQNNHQAQYGANPQASSMPAQNLPQTTLFDPFVNSLSPQVHQHSHQPSSMPVSNLAPMPSNTPHAVYSQAQAQHSANPQPSVFPILDSPPESSQTQAQHTTSPQTSSTPMPNLAPSGQNRPQINFGNASFVHISFGNVQMPAGLSSYPPPNLPSEGSESSASADDNRASPTLSSSERSNK